jgi:hypothetical protein
MCLLVWLGQRQRENQVINISSKTTTALLKIIENVQEVQDIEETNPRRKELKKWS